MQKSAVEFYRKHLHALISTGKTEYKTESEIFEAAKEMEKEQMEITWNNAIDAQLKDKWDSYDDFHKTTFKSE